MGYYISGDTLYIDDVIINPESFVGRQDFTKVSMTNVQEIGDRAFSKTNLTTIHIPSSVRNIGTECFSGCSKLTSISVDSSNEYYDSRGGCNAIVRKSDETLVAGCSTTSVPSGIKHIGDGCFRGCILGSSSNEPRFVIPEGVMSIGRYAYAECSNLRVEAPYSVGIIWDYAFYKCKNLTFYNTDDENPVLLTDVCRGAFEQNTNINGTLTFGHNEYNIHSYVFYRSSGDLAISGLYAKSIGDYAFCSSNIGYPSLEGVAKIGNYAFYNGYHEEELRISNDVTIGKSAFQWNSPIRRIVLPNVISLGDYAFSQCESLHEVVLGSKLNTISSYLFWKCSSLTKVDIPPSVDDIGALPFYECGGGSKITLNFGAHSIIPRIYESSLDGISSSDMIVIPDHLYSQWISKWGGIQSRYYTMSSTMYMNFVIEDKTFIAERGMTWGQWAESVYAKAYQLPDRDMTVQSLSIRIVADRRYLNYNGTEVLLCDTINWPSYDTVMSVAYDEETTVDPNDEITPSATYRAIRGMMRSPVWDAERGRWLYHDYSY